MLLEICIGQLNSWRNKREIKINSLIQTDIAQFESDGFFNIEIEGEMIELQLTDVEISSQDIPGWLVASEDGLTVALDINLTDVLKKEGLAFLHGPLIILPPLQQCCCFVCWKKISVYPNQGFGSVKL
mgnify:CR=1 FL=1